MSLWEACVAWPCGLCVQRASVGACWRDVRICLSQVSTLHATSSSISQGRRAVLTRRKIITLPLIPFREQCVYDKRDTVLLLRSYQYLNYIRFQQMKSGILSFSSQALLILTIIHSVKHTEHIYRHFQGITTNCSLFLPWLLFIFW